MKVMLISPSFSQPVESKKRCMVPLGIAYIGSYLRANGIDVQILDSVVEGYNTDSINDGMRTFGLSLEEIGNAIGGYSPDFVGVSCLMTQQWKNALAVCRIAKESNPKIHTVMGGCHPSVFPRSVLKHSEVDSVVMGEGEVAMLEVARHRLKGMIQMKPLNIDKIPWPARDLFSIEKYLKINMPENIYSPHQRVTQILTSRGCPFRCVFCATTNFHGQWRGRTPADVVSEAEHLKREYGIDELNIVDENFILNRNRTIEILKGFERLNIAWSNPGGIWVNGLDFELLDLMKSSGCYQLTFPVETSNSSILREVIHKPINLKSVKPLVRYCRKIGIDTHAFFISGFPQQTKQNMLDDYKFALDCGFTSVTFNLITPLPGSELYEQYKTQVDIDNINYIKASIKHPSIPAEELEQMVRDFNRKFNRSIIWRNPVIFIKKYIRTLLHKFSLKDFSTIFDRQ